MSFITAIGTANPAHRFTQATIADFMLRSMKLKNGEARKLKTIFRASGIEYRYSVLEDYGRAGDYTFFSRAENFEPFPTTEDRLRVFRKEAAELSVNAVKDLLSFYPSFDLQQVSHLVVVCCTGMYAPGLDIDLVKQLGLKATTERTAINFMGCYAAFNGLKVADAICKSNTNAKVLIVCTELCSLHFQAEGTEDNLLANALFGDGAAAILVEGKSNSNLHLKLECFHNDLSPNGEQDMAWTIGDLGFEMKLSSYVPDIIKGGITTLTNTLLEKISMKLSDIAHFAIHPGGKRILEVIGQTLGISNSQNAHSYNVLRRYGNMSSATVPFVLRDLVNNLGATNRGERILSFAFGPGLTLESMVLKIENV